MPYYCRSRVSQALNHGAGRSVKDSKILVLGVAYKADISDMRESPAVKLIELLRKAGADVSYHDPHVPSFTEDGMTLSSVPLVPGDYHAVVIATAHSGIDYAQLVDDAALVVDLRNATGKARRHERSDLEAVTRVAHAGVGGWGRNVVRVIGELSELAWICDTDEARRADYADRYPKAKTTASFDELLARRHRRRGGHRDARPDPLRAREAGARSREARLRREAAGDARRGDGGARRDRAGEQPRPDAGAPAAVPPRLAQGEGARRDGRARRCRVRLRQPPEPRRDPLQRERAVVARCPRPLRDPVAARRGAE